MKLGIILSQTEAETVFDALRLGNYSLKQGDSVQIFLIGKGVELDKISDPKFDVREQAQAVPAGGGQFLACGTCLKLRPFLSEHYGNPSNHHWAGAPAKQALEKARGQVASLLGCSPEEIIFTSGGTEANNHAIKGSFFSRREKGNHIITTQVEHPAVLQPCRFLETLGAEVTRLPVDGTGMLNPEDVRKAITPRTILVSVMHANNEVGTIQQIAEISRITRERGVVFHTDAAQSVGKISAKVAELGVHGALSGEGVPDAG